jgi:hypothetical protein
MLAACLLGLMTLGQAQAEFVETRHVYERGTPCVLHLRAPEGTGVAFDTSGCLVKEAVAGNEPVPYEIDTRLLRVGDYVVRARLTREGEPAGTVEFPLGISPARDTERMSVWRWGGGYGDPQWWIRRGFTGAFLGLSTPLESMDSSAYRSVHASLETSARHDYEQGFYFHPLMSKRFAETPEVLCLLPDGSRDPDTAYPLEPAVADYAYRVADSWVAAFHDYPGLRHVMLNSEVQVPFCLNAPAVEMARAELGFELKDMVASKWGPVEATPEEVRDGVIEDDNPRYRFLQWWWQRGHGTALVNERMHEIVKGHNPGLLTWHEPYRLAPVRGSHKGLDAIATWTYGYPDLKRLCYTTYLQAAARPEGQLVQQDITLFVYARYVMPVNESTADLSRDFAGKDFFFTASPDYAREAMWLVLSQRPDMLCFYSAGVLSPDVPTNDPFYASPETFDAIGQTCEEVVKPFGPAIRKSRRVEPRVAVLMSAAATWFGASPGLPGYPNEQTLPYATLLMMNHVPFDVLLDEDIVEDALDRYSVLVMPRADTLTRSMYDRIVAFAEKGGKVIADASLRASIPNAQVTRFDFTHQRRIDGEALAAGNAVTAEEDRAIMEGYARELQALLSDVPRPCAADSPRVLVNSLEGGAARYHFFVNDDRTYGPRFGSWKLHFELGVPQAAEARVALEGRPALYDVLLRKPIEYRTEDGCAVFPIRMTAARGRIVAALPEPVNRVEVVAPDGIPRGLTTTVRVRVVGDSGEALAGVLPLSIEIVDALGRPVVHAPYAATTDGTYAFELTPALNDAAGDWRVRVTELVAGKSGEATVNVAP